MGDYRNDWNCAPRGGASPVSPGAAVRVMSEPPRCAARTRKGYRCRIEAQAGSLWCHTHNPDGLWRQQHPGMPDPVMFEPDESQTLLPLSPSMPPPCWTPHT
jgi:hypothetical protein